MRFMLRQAVLSFVILTVVGIVIAGGSVLAGGWHGDAWHAARSPAAFLMFVPAAQFLLGLLYYKLRDAIFGPRWARKSNWRVIAYLASIALVAFVLSFGFVAASTWSISKATEGLLQIGALAAAVALAEFVVAQVRGPLEICDTVWACMDVGDKSEAETV